MVRKLRAKIAAMRLKNKIFLFFSLLIAFIIITVSAVTYRLFAKETESIVIDSVLDMLGQASGNLNSYMQEIDSVVNSLLIDREFCASLRKTGQSSYEQALLQSSVQFRLQAVSKVKHHIGNMYIITNDDRFYTNNTATTANSYILVQNWREQILEEGIRLIIPPKEVGTFSGVSAEVRTGQYFSVLYPAREIGQQNIFGMIGVEINVALLHQLSQYDNLDPYQGAMMILDQEGGLVYAEEEKRAAEQLELIQPENILQTEYGSYTATVDQVPTLVVFERCNPYGWYLVKLIPMQAILSTANNLTTVIWAIGLVALLVLLAASYYLADRVTRPLRELQQQIQRIEMGNLNLELPLGQQGEVYELASSFQKMLLRLKDSLEEIYETERQKRELEINLLQHQIYPHFLYNTLDSINWLARMQNAKTISQMITALNRMLRMSIYNGDEMNTIEDELTVVNSFLVLQKLGYHHTFEIEYQVDERMLNCLIPKLTLQPLVENALLHGFEDQREDAKIVLSVQLFEDQMVLCVTDNGKGMSEKELQKLRTVSRQKTRRFSGIGIHNIDQRLKLCFRGQAGLIFESIPDQKTTARVTMPVWRKNQDDKSINC